MSDGSAKDNREASQGADDRARVMASRLPPPPAGSDLPFTPSPDGHRLPPAGGKAFPRYATLEEPLEADRPDFAPERVTFRDHHWGRQLAMVSAALLVIGGGIWGVTELMSGLSPSSSSSATPSAAPAKTCPAKTTIKVSKVPKPGAINVRIVNATAQSGWATANGAKIRERGFQLAGVGNDTSNRAVNGVGELRYGDAGAKAAARVSFYFPEAKLVPVKRDDAVVEVVLGPDFVRFQSIYEADKRAEKKKSVTVPLNPKVC